MNAVAPPVVRPAIQRFPVEEVPPGENAAIAGMVETLKEQLTKRYPQGVIRRDAHPKHYGLVTATFIVDEKIPVALRHGLFREPGTAFSARIRFSNGHPIVGHDLVHDLRGFAMKVLLGPQRPDDPIPFLDDEATGLATHDFVMATGEAFFGRDAVDFVDFLPASEHWWTVPFYFVRKFPRRLRGGWQMLSAQSCPRSPLDAYFFSQTPYRLGPHCVKYQVRRLEPRRVKRDPWYRWFGVRHLLASIVTPIGMVLRSVARRLPGFDVLRSSLQRDLHDEGATLEFLVQRWPDLSRLPVWAIENATRRWEGRWERVARIEIPAGQPEVGTAENLQTAERLNFTPWRAWPEHQPLGSVNRARLEIYKAISAFRTGLGHPQKQGARGYGAAVLVVILALGYVATLARREQL